MAYAMTLFPNKVTFWGTGGQDLNIWIWGEHNSIITMLKSFIQLFQSNEKGQLHPLCFHALLVIYNSTYVQVSA